MYLEDIATFALLLRLIFSSAQNSKFFSYILILIQYRFIMCVHLSNTMFGSDLTTLQKIHELDRHHICILVSIQYVCRLLFIYMSTIYFPLFGCFLHKCNSRTVLYMYLQVFIHIICSFNRVKQYYLFVYTTTQFTHYIYTIVLIYRY